MAAVTCSALTFHNRFMLKPLTAKVSFGILMTVKAELPGYVLEKIGLVGSVRCVTFQAFTLGKRGMRRFFLLFLNQVFMAGETKFSFISCFFEQAWDFTSMGSMTAGTFSTDKGLMLT
jgi:hypothetical protein